jgi:hypothetical protein
MGNKAARTASAARPVMTTAHPRLWSSHFSICSALWNQLAPSSGQAYASAINSADRPNSIQKYMAHTENRESESQYRCDQDFALRSRGAFDMNNATWPANDSHFGAYNHGYRIADLSDVAVVSNEF